MKTSSNQTSHTTEELLKKRDELWKEIKDFDSTSYEKAERIGRVIREINKQIQKNKSSNTP